MSTAFLMLGTNLGDKKMNLENACTSIEKKIGRISRKSSVYETEPWGYDDGPNFLNQVVQVETTLTPLELLSGIMGVEAGLGRKRGNVRYAPRTMDIDILLYDNLIINQPVLIIPHPELANRKFVLEPLAELVPELEHPGLRKKISELLAICKDSKNIVKNG